MKISLVVLMISLLTVYFEFPCEVVQISGVVIDNDSGEKIFGATVREGSLKNGAETNEEGRFTINVSDVKNDLIISFIGYEDYVLKIEPGKLYYEVKLAESAQVLESVIVTAYKAPLKKIDNTTSGYSITDASMASLPSKEKESIRSRKDKSISSSISVGYKKEDDDTPSGQVTAGEWNDLHHWDKWQALLKDKEYSDMHKTWGIYPDQRYAAFVVNNNNQPINGVVLNLQAQDGKVLWSAVSDVNGKAELWAAAYDGKSVGKDLEILYDLDGEKGRIRSIKNIKNGVNEIVINKACQPIKQAQICFVVDATGSMSDEINYLKSDLASVINGIKASHVSTTIELSSIFYRDNGDDYVTKASSFSTDLDNNMRFIKAQSASGGGDVPEAVEQGLKLALNQSWSSDNTVPKIIFLLLDAPPHSDVSSMQLYKHSINEAAKRGIKIIPISASGIDRPTEFLLKFTALLTNGTYVFITDDSGIGDAHLAPVHNDYTVEKLNGVLARLIAGYITNDCTNTSQSDVTTSVKLYPNPASHSINLTYKDVPNQIHITSATGQVVMQVNADGSPQLIDISNLLSGIYFVKLMYGDKSISSKFIIVK
jgi:CarboxypepD_reg-like domain/Secretion system C-terminal sorting domain/von Willebrand factor type A domain